ncbi:hypothetical protein NMG60_11006327 [Bertholletia excelsa]
MSHICRIYYLLGLLHEVSKSQKEKKRVQLCESTKTHCIINRMYSPVTFISTSETLEDRNIFLMGSDNLAAEQNAANTWLLIPNVLHRVYQLDQKVKN